FAWSVRHDGAVQALRHGVRARRSPAHGRGATHAARAPSTGASRPRPTCRRPCRRSPAPLRHGARGGPTMLTWFVLAYFAYLVGSIVTAALSSTWFVRLCAAALVGLVVADVIFSFYR